MYVRCSPRPVPTSSSPAKPPRMNDMVCAVVVTHRRPDELAKSLDVLTTQSRLPDDDGHPQDSQVLATLLACAETHRLAEVSPMVCNADDPQRLAFPLRRGLVWRRLVSELRTEAGQELLPSIASQCE